ncbi:alpha/beta hydrolase [Pseudomonadales bacterium]|nr:alpha/beta hydrolase [Betaproteobacteria bacterium]MDA8911851.1 alpha/beta hydrolase [Pseudomonadales bacterium]
MIDHQIQSADNRTISFADYGPASGLAVLCCHGGPGSRLEPRRISEQAAAAGFRLIGIDRPGYGKSTPLPGRSICDWTQDAIAVADHLMLDQFLMVGVSTGGSYALATAAVAPSRVLGVLVCCGMTDIAWANDVDDAKMVGAQPIWNAPDRDAAIAVAIEQFGERGDKVMVPDADAPPVLSPADMAVVMDPAYAEGDPTNERFAQGVLGYADDRIADGPRHGWSSFEIDKVVCPVIVIHGEQDWIVPVAQAHHTAAILRDAELRTFAEHGHLSVGAESVSSLIDLRARIAPLS